MREDSQVPYDLETQKLRCEQAWLRFKSAIYDLVLGKPAPEAKFNPYHDELGRFTFAPGGAGGGASHSSVSGHHDASDSGAGQKDHYETSDPKFKVPAEIRPRLNTLASEFHSATGKTLVVTSVARDAHAQADAMYIKFTRGGLGSEYIDRTAFNEIHDAYILNQHQGKSPGDTVRAMQSVISAQMARGIYISKHLKAGAVDIRSSSLTKAEVSKVLEIATRHGVRAIHEDAPNHIHLQF